MKTHNAVSGPGGRLLRGIKAALGDVSPEGGVERYSETLQPGWDVFERIDHQLPLGRRFYWRQIAVAAVVGERSILCLRCPAVMPGTPPMLAVVQWGKVDGDSWTWREDGGLLSTDATATGFTRDLRIRSASGRSSCTLISASETSANAGNNLLSFLTTDIFLMETGICVVAPGREIRLVGGTDNTAAVFAFGWMERLAMPGELDATL